MNETPVVLVGPVGDQYGVPSLAISLLKSSLKENGIGCRALYPNILMFEALGMDTYAAAGIGSINGLFLERLFAPMAHEELEDRDLTRLSGHGMPEGLAAFYDVTVGKPKVISAETAEKADEGARDFLAKVTEEIVRLSPSIVGFSSTYQTTNSVLAMAKAVRKRLPSALLVVGGNNCEGPMGRELAEKAHILDFIFQGEADFDFARFCRNYLGQGRLPAQKVVTCSHAEEMDKVPSPDYSDFFRQCSYPAEHICLTFETSRGCWWGHRHQCLFCGESALDLPYRMRSPEAAMEELRRLRTLHPEIERYLVADSILPSEYFTTFLPQLAESGFEGEITYETKANLSREQVRLLAEANVTRILPGVESLSTRVLRMLNKGTTAAVNIRLLRHCREEGVDVVWFLLMGIPGDTVADYEAQLALMPLLQHLPPPSAGPVRIQRNSPYFKEGATFGVRNITPLAAYAHAFPKSFDLDRLAYFFTADHPSEVRENPDSMIPFMASLRRWQKRWWEVKVPELSVRPLPEGRWEVTDTRDCAVWPARIIDGEGYALLKRCRWGRPLESFHPLESVESVDPSEPAGPKETVALKGTAGPGEMVRDFLAAGYLVEVDGKVLSLVCENAWKVD